MDLEKVMETQNELEEQQYYYSNIEILSMGAFTMLCIVGLIMNALVLIAFVKLTLYTRPNNVQLFSLAIDDFGTALLVEPLVILSYLKPSTFTNKIWLCRVFSTLLHVFPWGSTISILFLSLTRVIIVICPLRYRELITTKRIYYSLIWKYFILLGFVGLSNPFWIAKFSMKYKQCFVNYVSSTVNSSSVFMEELDNSITVPTLHVTAGIIIFVINMVVVGKLIDIKLRKLTNGKMPAVFNAGVELILLVAVYMITTISIPAIFITDLMGLQLSVHRISLFAFIAKFLFYVQPILNPLIYVIRRPEYRFNITRAPSSGRGDIPPPLPDYPIIPNNRNFYRVVRLVMNSNKFIRYAREESQKTKVYEMKKTFSIGYSKSYRVKNVNPNIENQRMNFHTL